MAVLLYNKTHTQEDALKKKNFSSNFQSYFKKKDTLS